jgi:hypothetical protein
VHILKELVVFPNSHTKSDQGAIATHNCHLGRCPIIWSLGTSFKVRHLDFLALEMGHGMDPIQEVGASRGDA